MLHAHARHQQAAGESGESQTLRILLSLRSSGDIYPPFFQPAFTPTHRERSPTKLLGLEEWRRGFTPPRSAWKVCSSTPRQTRRTCWIRTWLQGTERQASAHMAGLLLPVSFGAAQLRYRCCSCAATSRNSGLWAGTASTLQRRARYVPRQEGTELLRVISLMFRTSLIN